MDASKINVYLAFLEGASLIASPCILPILPIILSGSLTGSRLRPYGIICGFTGTFTLITLCSQQFIQTLHINPNVLRTLSLLILALLGIIMISSQLSELFMRLTQKLTRIGQDHQTLNDPNSGFFAGIGFGALVGVIWTPCAGPVLAAVIVQIVLQQSSQQSLFTAIAFAIGAGLPMLLIALLGRGILESIGAFRNHLGLVRKSLGVIILLTVLLSFVPNALLPTSLNTQNKILPSTQLIQGIDNPYPAPALVGIEHWLNSKPLSIAELSGKVVLVDFWTYSCINCIRTLPYIKDWWSKYHDKGLVIIGVHTPEFAFEHELSNIQQSVLQNDIRYPVAVDNHFGTWQNFQNHYWPAHYLIDKTGRVVYTHFGEGQYEITEINIRYLLGFHGDIPVKEKVNSLLLMQETPETYLGFQRAENFAQASIRQQDVAYDYHYPNALDLNQWALQGKWIISSDHITSSEPNAAIKIHFRAGKIFAVMGSPGQKSTVNIQMSDKKIAKLPVEKHQLYLLHTSQSGTEDTLELVSNLAGLELYTFTFGE